LADVDFVVQIIDHGLRSSASPVIMATGLVSGKWQILTPYNRLSKNLSQEITSATPLPVPSLVQIRPWGAFVQRVKYSENCNFYFIPFF